jgi:hypothetical protein
MAGQRAGDLSRKTWVVELARRHLTDSGQALAVRPELERRSRLLDPALINRANETCRLARLREEDVGSDHPAASRAFAAVAAALVAADDGLHGRAELPAAQCSLEWA